MTSNRSRDRVEVDATGARVHVSGLLAHVTHREIAYGAGVSTELIRSLADGRTTHISGDVEEAVLAVNLDDLRALTLDEIAVQRAISGDRVRLNPYERRQAIRVLKAAGLSRHRIAARLRVSGSTVAAALRIT